MGDKGYIHEDSFKTILQDQSTVGIIDTTELKITGLQLNDMITNRGRALIINHPEFIKDTQKKYNKDNNNSIIDIIEDNNASLNKTIKKTKIVCKNPLCLDVNTNINTISRIQWNKCPKSRCNSSLINFKI